MLPTLYWHTSWENMQLKSHGDLKHYDSKFLFSHVKRIWILKTQETLASFAICHRELSTAGIILPKWVHASSWVGHRPAKKKVPSLIPGLQVWPPVQGM